MGDALSNEIAVLNERALRAIPGPEIELRPTAEGLKAPSRPPENGAELDPVSGVWRLPPGRQSAVFDEATNRWVLHSEHRFEGLTTFRENLMGLSVLSQERGYGILDGPGGSAPGAHRWNQRGFDGAAIKLDGPFKLLIPDDKPPGRPGVATALTTNRLQNLRLLDTHLQKPQFDEVPRIDQARVAVQVAIRREQASLPPPADVEYAITQEGRQTRTLPKGPPATPAEVAAAKAQLDARRPPQEEVRVVEQRPRALSTPPAVVPPLGQRLAAPGLAAVAQFIGPLLSWAHTTGLAHRTEAEIKRVEAETEEYRRANPDKGVLVVLQYRQFVGTRDSGIPQPGATLANTLPQKGARSFEEARALWERTPKYEAPTPYHRRLPDQYHWIPPLGESQPDAPAGPGTQQPRP